MSARVLLSAPALALVATAVVAQETPGWVHEARDAASELARALQSELASALSAGGPSAGIETCRVRATQIADAVSGPDLTVGRTALRLRNADNAPDDWETGVLRDFRERLEAGADPASLQTWHVQSRDGERIGRWMKAIPMQPQCLVCHGNAVPEDVADVLSRLYPEDRATGFAVGDLRGAFTVTVELDSRDSTNEADAGGGHDPAGRD